MEKFVSKENIERWSGYADFYNDSRPVPPEVIAKSVLLYMKNNPEIVVDLGSGTGLSTMMWQNIAKEIVGIEPNDDMRETAEKTTKSNNITYKKGVSNETNLPSDYADVVTISQAFHWMDMDSTLLEIYRILKSDGILAIFDCDWPPAIDWGIEKAYIDLKSKGDAICFSQEKHAVQNDKSSYISVLNSFGKFRFLKEIVCHKVEKCTPKRMIGITLTQGGIQDAMKIDASFKKDVDEYCDLVNARCDYEFEIVFSYRLRIAVK